MRPRPLIPASEKDKHRTRDQLMKELAELRARLAAKTEGLASRDRVVGMLEGITEPVLALDDESKVVYANPAAVKVFAKGSEAIEGRSLWDLYPKGRDTLFYHAYEKARAGRSTAKFREKHRLSGKWYDVYLYPVPGGMTVLFNDITVSRQMEELPRLALTLLHNLKENVFLLRADGRLFHVNQETKDSLGYSSEELLKMDIFDVVVPACAQEWRELLGRIRQHGSVTFESRLRARDGREFPVEVNASFIELYGNQYYTVSARDITARKLAEEELRKLTRVVEEGSAIVVITDVKGDIEYVNPQFTRATGYTLDEVRGKNPRILKSEDTPKEEHKRLWDTILSGKEWRGQFCNRKKNGDLYWESAIVSPLVDAQGRITGFMALKEDITERKRYEEALIDAEDFNRSVLDSLPSNIAVLDDAGTILYVNKSWKTFAITNNISSAEAAGVGINYFEVCRKASGPRAEEASAAFDGMMSVLAGETDLFELEYPCHSTDVRRWFQMRVTPFTGRKKHGIVVYHNDITARKGSEEVLSESEANLARAQQIAHIGNWAWDIQKDRVQCSDEFYRIFGMGRRDFITYAEFINMLNPEDRGPVHQAVDAALREGERYDIEYRVVRPDGAERVVHAEGEATLDEAGKPVMMFGTVKDITERKQAEGERDKLLYNLGERVKELKALDSTARIFQKQGTIPELLQEVVSILPLAWQYPDITTARITYDGNEYRTKKFIEGRWGQIAEFVTSNGKKGAIEIFYIEEMPPEVEGPFLTEERNLINSLAEMMRIYLDRMQSEEALRETRDYLESLIKFANAPIIVWDPGFTITRFNRAFERLSGYAAGEVVGKDLSVLFPADSRDESLGKIRRTLAGEYWESVEIPILHKDGSVRIALWNSANIHNEDGTRLLATIAQGQDITERKQAEEALRNTSDYLDSLINFANAPIIVWDPAYRITRFNHAFERLTDYGAGEVIGKGLDVLFPEDSREASLQKIRRSSTEYWESIEIPILSKDGGIRVALWNSANIYSKDGATLLATIAQGQDITERKQAEEALQVAKAQAELYVDLMGHDINNLNQIALGSLEIALTELEQAGKLDIRGKQLIDKSLESLSNSSALIKNVQKLQRASTGGIRLQAMDAAEVLKGIIQEQRSMPGKEVTIYYKNPAVPCLVTANELLRDVFSNLIGNAIKHSGPEKHITIGVAVESVDEGGRKFCRIAVDDNGPGIHDEVKARLFQRLSRGQTKAKGSGLGLYLVKTLVEHYEGKIWVEDRLPGDYSKGTKFVVMIPSFE